MDTKYETIGDLMTGIANSIRSVSGSNEPIAADDFPEKIATLSRGSSLLDIRTFGATGDGVTDDTAAIKAAVATGLPLYFPAGTYLLGEQIDVVSDLRWSGDGDTSIIKLLPIDQSRPEEYGGRTVYNVSILKHDHGINSRIDLENIVFDGSKEDYDADILGNGSSRYDHIVCLELFKPKSVHMHNVTVRNATIEGCYLLSDNNAEYIQISDCRFYGNGFYREDSSGLQLSGAHRHTQVSNCTFYENGFHGLLIACIAAQVNNVKTYKNGYDGVCLWGEASENVVNNVFAYENRAAVQIRKSPTPKISDAEEEPSVYNVVSNVMSVNNLYGIMLGYTYHTRIINFVSKGDQYSYAFTSNRPSSGDFYHPYMNPALGTSIDLSSEGCNPEGYRVDGEVVGVPRRYYLDVTLESGVIGLGDGSLLEGDTTTAVRTANYITLLPDLPYLIRFPNNDASCVRAVWYDADKNYLDADTTWFEDDIMYFPASAKYLKFYCDDTASVIRLILQGAEEPPVEVAL